MSSSRKASHKMKSAFDEQNKSLLRVHRRSLDQRDNRQAGMNKFRQIDDMSPVIESQDGSANPSAAATPVGKNVAAVSRMEKLKKWKEERELKRKLEAMEKAKSKPGFKVFHVSHKESHLYQKDDAIAKKQGAQSVKPAQTVGPAATRPRTVVPSTSKAPTIKTSAKPAASDAAKRTASAPHAAKKTNGVPATTRTTRSRSAATKTVPDIPQKKVKQSPQKRGAQAHFMAPTAAWKSRACSTKKKETSEAPAAQRGAGRRKAAAPVSVKDNKGKVTTKRGGGEPHQSFAPKDFCFEPPSNVQSFVFKPLSPASAANFLFPQAESNPADSSADNPADNTTMSAFSTRVGRTSTPKRNGQPLTSSEEDSSGEGKKSEVKKISLGSEGVSQTKLKRRSSPMASSSQPKKQSFTERRDPADSGIGAMTVGTDYAPTQNSFDTALSEEDLHTSLEKSTPGKRRKGKKSQETVSKSMDTEDASEQEKQTDVSEAEGAIPEAPTSSSSLKSRKNTRKSKRVTILEDPVTSTEDSQSEETLVVKKHPKSRRSGAKSKSENLQDSVSAQSLMSEEAIEEEQSPVKSRRSRRSAAAKSSDEQTIHETKADSATKQRRKSRRSILKSDSICESESEAASLQASMSKQEEEKQETPKKSRRQSRRSVAATPKDKQESRKSGGSDNNRDDSVTACLAAMEIDTEEASTSNKMETDDVFVPDSQLVSEPTTPENRGRNLRSVQSKDDLFLTPGPPLSQKRSSVKRRRRTATMVALSTAKSPEEAIQIIATSPMVEMTRRTPKSKSKSSSSSEHRRSRSMIVQESEEGDMAVAPLQLSSAFEAAAAESTVTGTDSGATTDLTETDAGAQSQATGSTPPQQLETGDSDTGVKKRDVTQFRDRLLAEKQKLTDLSKHWTAVTENTKDIPEEVEGQIRTTVCYAQLLMDRKGKFHQYAGLVDACEAGDPSTTCQDLQGFWDMIFIQAEEIYAKFEKLQQLQKNNWQLEESEAKPVPQPPKQKKPVAGASKKQKPAGKSKFAAFRAQMMQQRKAQEAGEVLAVASEAKEFDAGFFKVSSPIRTPTYHCEGGTPSKTKMSSVSEGAADPSSTPTTSRSGKKEHPPATTTPTAGSKGFDKENVGLVLLRRSMGVTPGRSSFAPAIPSPLLKDTTPRSTPPPLSPSKSANSPAGNSDPEERSKKAVTTTTTTTPADHTPARRRKSRAGRRSTRSRLSFEGEGKDSLAEVTQDVDLTAYLQPSTSQPTSPLTENVQDDGSPFTIDDILKHCRTDSPVTTSPGSRRKSKLKILPSTEKRRSRRSVSFAASTNTPEGGFALPSTPYNKNSLVAGKRVTRRSTTQSDNQGEATSLTGLMELCTSPRARRSARISLLYTPPKHTEPTAPAPAKDVPVATLISI